MDRRVLVRQPVNKGDVFKPSGKRRDKMDDKVFASATMTTAMTDYPYEYESIPTVDVFDTDQGNDLVGKQAGGNGTGLLRSLPIGAVVMVPVALAGYLLLASCQGGGY